MKAGAALYALGGVAVKLGMDFEKEMSNLNAITGMTTDEMKEMETGIRNISTNTGVSLMDIAKNAKMVAEAGGDMNRMMEQLQHGTNLAQATQTDMATSLDFLGSAMKTFGLETDQTQEVVDSLSYLTTIANVELSQIAASFVSVGGAANASGLSMHDVNSVLYTFAERGLKGADAGHKLNSLLMRLTPTSETAMDAWYGLGVALYDAEGNARETWDILKDLEQATLKQTDATKDMTDEQLDLLLVQALAASGMKGWRMMMDEGIDSILELSDELANAGVNFDGLGQAAGMAAIQQDNLSGEFNKLKMSLSNLGIEFYQNVDTPLKDVVKTAKDMVGQLTEALQEGGLTGLVEKVGDVLAQAVQYIVEQAPKFVEAAVSLITSLIKGLTDNKDNILAGAKETFMMIIDGLKTILPMLVPLATDIITELLSGFITYYEMLFTTGVEIFTQLVMGLAENMPDLVVQAKDAIMNIVNGLADNLPLVLQAGVDILFELIRGITDLLPDLIPLAVNIILTLVDTLLDNLGELIMVALDLILALVEGIVRALPDLAKAIPRIIFTIVDQILNRLPEIIDVALEIIMALVYGLIEALPELIAMIPKINIAILEAIINNLDKIIEAAFKIIVALALGLVEAIPELLASIPKIIKSIWDAFTNINWGDIGKNIMEGLKNGLLGGVTKVVDTVKNVASSIWDGITGFFGIHSPSVKFRDELGKMMMAGLEIGIDENAIKAQKAAEKMSKMTFDAATLWIKDYRNSTDYLKSEEIAMWDELAQQYEAGSKERVKAETEARKLRESALKDEAAEQKATLKEQTAAQKEFWDTAKLMIADYKNDLEYSIEEEMKMWEALGEHYTEISKEKVEIDKNIIKLREDLRKEELEKQKQADIDSFNFSKTWIETKKALTELTTQEEIEAWQRVADRYEDGSKQKEEAEKNLSRLRDELRKEEEKAIKEMEKLEDEYQKTLENRANAIFNTFSMFADVNLQETNVDKNTAKVEKSKEAYDKVHDSLKQLDVDQQKAYDALQTKIGEVNQKMQDGTLTTDQYNKLQKEAAEAQKKYGEESAKIHEKRVEAVKKLDEAQIELTKATEEAAKSQAQVMAENLEDQIANMEEWEKQMTELSKKGLDEGLLAELRKMGPSAVKYLEQLNGSTDEELTKMSDLYKQKHELARRLATDELVELRRETDQKITDILVDLTNRMASDAKPIGEDMVQGIINGVNERGNELRNTMTRLMNDIIAIANQIPQISSPSRVFRRIGGFITEGLTMGIEASANMAIGAVGDMFEGIIDIAESIMDINSPSQLFKTMGEMVGEGFIDGVESMGDKIQETVEEAFSGFDVESIDAKYNIQRSGSMATAGGPNQRNREGGRPVEFKFQQTIIIDKDTDPRKARGIGKKIFEEAKETARSKGVDVL